MNSLSFTALDIETADHVNHFICQIGIVKVINGVISEKFMSLIQPPNNIYSIHNFNVHGISPEMTQNSPTFYEVWPKIRHYFDDQIIVCHNSAFNIPKVENTLHYYNLPVPRFRTECTLKLFGKKLEDCCADFSIDLSKHHDALEDATACAKLFLLNHNCSHPKEKGNTNRNSAAMSFYNNKFVEKEDLVPNFENCDSKSPFYMKKVVLTGDLAFISRQDIAHELKTKGADVNTCISKKTDIVIVGDNPGPSKMQKIEELRVNGYNIQIIHEDELLQLLKNE